MFAKIEKFFKSLPGTVHGYLLWATIQHGATVLLTYLVSRGIDITTLNQYGKVSISSMFVAWAIFTFSHRPNNKLTLITGVMAAVFYPCFYLMGYDWSVWLWALPIHAVGGWALNKFTDIEMRVLFWHPKWSKK